MSKIKDLAYTLFTQRGIIDSGGDRLEREMKNCGFEYRKGKGDVDIKLALKTVLRKAYPKIEFELHMMQDQLSKYIKPIEVESRLLKQYARELA